MRRYPGESNRRQAVHTVYGGAHLFRSDSAQKLGEVALRSLKEYARDARTLARALKMDASLATKVYDRIVEKLRREPVEDFRLDFEDGYGNRAGRGGRWPRRFERGGSRAWIFQENAAAVHRHSHQTAERRSARAQHSHARHFCHGVARKNRREITGKFRHHRSEDSIARTNDGGDSVLRNSRAQKWPNEWCTEDRADDRNAAGDHQFARRSRARFARRRRGRPLPKRALRRLRLHGVVRHHRRYQTMGHPACDFARQMMLVSLAGTGIHLSDGATNILPVGPHRASEGESLTQKQQAENVEAVYAAWRLGFNDNLHSLRTGFYQGWDLHPAQFVTRYAAVYSFFPRRPRERIESAENFCRKGGARLASAMSSMTPRPARDC